LTAPAGAARIRHLRLPLLVVLLAVAGLLIQACTSPRGNRGGGDDDDSGTSDDDDTQPDDDDTQPDDDDVTPPPDDDDFTPDDDDDTTGGDCVDDEFEPNDEYGSAEVVSSSGGNWFGLTLCDTTDQDWFELSLAAGTEIFVDIFFTNAEGDTDVELTDDTGTLIDGGYSAGDNESFSVVIEAAGTYYVHVYLYDDDGSIPGNTYDMSIAIAAAE